MFLAIDTTASALSFTYEFPELIVSCVKLYVIANLLNLSEVNVAPLSVTNYKRGIPLPVFPEIMSRNIC